MALTRLICSPTRNLTAFICAASVAFSTSNGRTECRIPQSSSNVIMLASNLYYFGFSFAGLVTSHVCLMNVYPIVCSMANCLTPNDTQAVSEKGTKTNFVWTWKPAILTTQNWKLWRRIGTNGGDYYSAWKQIEHVMTQPRPVVQQERLAPSWTHLLQPPTYVSPVDTSSRLGSALQT